MSSLAERLEGVRRQRFVGRQREKELFRAALAAETLPFVLIFLYGPGGIGKTSLLREFAATAGQMGFPVLRLDGRNLDPSPAAFLAALQNQLGLPPMQDVWTALAAVAERLVLLVDTTEQLVPLMGWLQEDFLPRLPDNVLVVLAGRTPPAPRWRADPGWQALMRIFPLAALSPEESRAFLIRRQVPAAVHDNILDFAHGHPLALSLVADVFAQQPETQFRPQNDPNLIHSLLEQLMQEAPSADHRAALEACSQVRLLSEPLLAAMLQLGDAYSLFDWLRRLSFIDAHDRGLYPHDLAREALSADLRWRDPGRQALLHDRARSYYMARFQSGDAREQRRVLEEYIFLHRDNPVIRAYFEWQSSGTVFTDAYRPEDTPALLDMIRRHEGEEAAEIAAYWLERLPGRVAIFRHAAGQAEGFLLSLPLEQMSPAERQHDPAVAAVWHYLDQQPPLRKGETATFFRFWMARESYQGVSAVQSRIFLNLVQHYLTAHGLAHSFIPCANPEFWNEIFTFANMERLPEADFTVGQQRFAVYGHDWRKTPPLLWLELMAQRELGGVPQVAQVTMEPAVTLSEEAFKEAVHDALRQFTNPVALQQNPLLQTRLVVDVVGPAERVESLRSVIRECAFSLQSHPRGLKAFRAVHHTYLQPTPTQEQAAELLDLPFSTYRRHLRAGIQQIADLLWLRMQGG